MSRVVVDTGVGGIVISVDVVIVDEVVPVVVA